jgi:peptidyl-tRNA hydrolase, PTH2 family
MSCVQWWERSGQAKVAVKSSGLPEMLEIAERARLKGLVTYIVMDAGRTQIAAGSRTVLAIGPAPAAEFNGVSDHLKLL